MTQLYEIKVSLSPNQKKNLSNAYHKRETIVLRLTKDSLSGNDTLYVPSGGVRATTAMHYFHTLTTWRKILPARAIFQGKCVPYFL